MADFDQAIRKVLRHEGVDLDDNGQPVPGGRTGWCDHRDDPGKVTNYGITTKSARRNQYLGSMRHIPFPKVLDIYRTDYWNKIHGDDIPDQAIAEEMMDTAANCGVGTVNAFLQITLNVLNVKGTRYADIAVDGAMGPNTIAALKSALAVAPWYRTVILRALDSLQAVRYIELAAEKEKFESFVPGWLRNRVGVKDDV